MGCRSKRDRSWATSKETTRHVAPWTRWHYFCVCFGGNYLGGLETPIDCAATAYQGLDLNDKFLIRFVGLDFLAGCTTELFLVAFLDIVPPNITLPRPSPYTCQPGIATPGSIRSGKKAAP